MSKRNTVCLVVIARDEARCIQRCLNSFSKHVDRMMVLDTGSKDNTVTLAKAAGAQVHLFKWVDSFAIARNAALKIAAADWHLVADADEWLESGAECLPELRAGHPNQIGNVLIRSQVDSPGRAGVLAAWLPRFLPGPVRYCGRIHEQLDTALPMVNIPLTFGHDGYCDEQMRVKRGRNEQLLRAALLESPDDSYTLFQLGSELYGSLSYGEAIEMFTQSLRLTPAKAQYRAALIYRFLCTLQAAREWAIAANLLEREMQTYSTERTFMLTVGNLFWAWAQDQPTRASNLLPMAENAWMQVLHLEQYPGVEQGYQLENVGERAARSLAVLCRNLGQDARARQYEAIADKKGKLGGVTTRM
jgi:glycosyltransferase involved in cell wall biosynthesis